MDSQRGAASRGRAKGSVWAFHWEHHRASRRHKLFDHAYAAPLFSAWNARSKEAAYIGIGAVVLATFFPVAPFFIGTCFYSAARYIRMHRRAHMDLEWAREHLPWHYDHHMGPDQEANWCVTNPAFDHLMGTRKPYAHTEREARDRARRAAAKVARRSTERAVAISG